MRAATVGLAMALAGCGFGPADRIGEPVLPGADVERLVMGNTFVGQTESGAPIEIYFREDGNAFMRGSGSVGVPFQDVGRWSIESDRLCTRWRQVRGRQKLCEWVTYDAQGFRTYTPAGTPSAQGRLVAGPQPGIGRLPPTPPRGG